MFRANVFGQDRTVLGAVDTLAFSAPFDLTRIDPTRYDFGHGQTCVCACCGPKEKVASQPAQTSVSSNAAAGDIPGDSTTTATIAIGGSVTSELEAIGDTDWFKITLQAGDTVDISLFGSGATPVSDTYLRIYDANGTLVAENDDGGAGLNSLIRFTASSGGTFYIEADSFDNNKIGEYTVEVTESEPLTVFSYDEIALQLTNGYWGGTSRSWNVGSDGQLTYNVSALPAEAQYLATQALLLWGDATGIEFVSVSSGAELTFQDTANGAYASTSSSGGNIISATINVSAAWLSNYGTGLDSYSFQTYIHEIGHALGLGHAGNYNGNAAFPTDALYLNDSWATTVMSYFSQTDNSYFDDLGFSRAFVTTPMVGDVVAIGNLYGLSTTTRLGNTVYGFNNTSGRDVYDAALSPATAYTIVDSGGRDTLDYSGFADDQLIDLRAETFSNVGGLVGNVSIARGTVIEDAKGGSGDDRIIGNAAVNTIRGNAGNDIISGGLGNDRLLGGDGDDTLRGESGNDRIEGNNGSDVLSGGSGDDIIDGKNDDDTVNGEDGDDRLYGAKGNDVVYGGDGKDVIYGGGGSDTIFGGVGSDWISGGHGNDMIKGDGGHDRIDGNDGNDRIYGGTGDDTIYGGNGHDTVDGGSGDDFIDGKDGSDKLYGYDGNDVMYGARDNDRLSGGNGSDEMYGGGGADEIYGGADDDELYGEYGNDVLNGGAGNDILTGGTGSDIFFFDLAGAGDADQITDFTTGWDKISLDAGEAFDALSGTGSLAGSAFRKGTVAQDADDRIIYDQTSGNLWYDADGDGAGAAQLFATVEPGTVLSASDFSVIDSASAATSATAAGSGKDSLITNDQVLFI